MITMPLFYNILLLLIIKNYLLVDLQLDYANSYTVQTMTIGRYVVILYKHSSYNVHLWMVIEQEVVSIGVSSTKLIKMGM